MRRSFFVMFVTLLLAACGDAETTDPRGYTKAPLEDAGVTIRAEYPTKMDSLGTPLLPRDTLITPEQAAAPAQPKD